MKKSIAAISLVLGSMFFCQAVSANVPDGNNTLKQDKKTENNPQNQNRDLCWWGKNSYSQGALVFNSKDGKFYQCVKTKSGLDWIEADTVI